ncbi:trypsin-like peptidase domain-containing protein [Streptomyces sp. MS06]|uniref:S1C family serine protease n=1 Tax=Streptomyces sp. MS06 TaxID=3385974 RepID=UPI0039A221B8
MTESIRRSGDYDAPYPSAPQHASSPVNPEWPPPPPHRPDEAPTMQQPAQQPCAGRPDVPARPAYAGQPDVPAQPAYAGQQAGSGVPPVNGEPGAAVQDPAPAAWPGHGGGGHDGGTTPLAAVPAGSPAPRRKRNRGPVALLAAVAIAAAAIGGGTAYAIQELTGQGTVAAAPSTSVVPAGKRGDIAAIAAAAGPSIVEVKATLADGSSTGSGVVITSDGEILTNNHVVSGASSVKVRTSDGKEYTARVVGTDSKKDLALIKLEGASGLKAASLGDSDNVQVGDTVVAIGSPEGLTGTVTSGIVSALNRDVTVPTEESSGQQPGGGRWPFEFGGRQFNGDPGSSTTTYKAIQTDASLNPGNSGGALIDANGNVIGINSAMYSASGSGSSSSADAGSVGLGFAIPINTVKADLANLRAGGTD